MATANRGFASMDRAKQKEIASKGGKTARDRKTAYRWSPDAAREAGKKGAKARNDRRAKDKQKPTS